MSTHDEFSQEYDLVFVPEDPESPYRTGYNDALLGLGNRSYMLLGTGGYERYGQGRLDGLRAKEEAGQ